MESDEIERLAEGFIECTLPAREWTHEAHLRVGLWYLLRYPEGTALELLRDRIRRYNIATGGVNTEAAGYHETITRFYVRIIAAFLAEVDRARPLSVLASELIERYGERGLPLRYYSRELLFSTRARLEWVEPDLRLLPE